MVVFEDVEDVKEWLAPLDYIAFWDAVEPYNLVLQDREHCDQVIASGSVDPMLVLKVLKGLATRELSKAFGLSVRTWHPGLPTWH